MKLNEQIDAIMDDFDFNRACANRIRLRSISIALYRFVFPADSRASAWACLFLVIRVYSF